jgi:hypothetical protein
MFCIRSQRVGVNIGRPRHELRKLTVEQVIEARLRYAKGQKDVGAIAKDLGVSKGSLEPAVLGKTYKDIPMPPKSSASREEPLRARERRQAGGKAELSPNNSRRPSRYDFVQAHLRLNPNEDLMLIDIEHGIYEFIGMLPLDALGYVLLMVLIAVLIGWAMA